jgi:hypothetical protein
VLAPVRPAFVSPSLADHLYELSTCHEGARPTRLCRPHHTARLTVLCVHRIPRPTFGNND